MMIRVEDSLSAAALVAVPAGGLARGRRPKAVKEKTLDGPNG